MFKAGLSCPSKKVNVSFAPLCRHDLSSAKAMAGPWTMAISVCLHRFSCDRVLCTLVCVSCALVLVCYCTFFFSFGPSRARARCMCIFCPTITKRTTVARNRDLLGWHCQHLAFLVPRDNKIIPLWLHRSVP